MALASPDSPALAPACLHCGQPVARGPGDAAAYCCGGCEAAHRLIARLGLDRYYRQRTLDPAVRRPRPDDDGLPPDPAAFVQVLPNGLASLHLMVEGLQCGACVWLIESALARQPGVTSARVSLSTRRLTVTWRRQDAEAMDVVRTVAGLGYRVVPYDPALLGSANARHEQMLLRALAVAGFAAGNVMLLSVAIWAGQAQGMVDATRDLLHWLSALIALPAIAYAGRPFFASALRSRRTNMDVPISVAIVLTPLMSLVETIDGGAHAYFDSSVTLVFFLLVGRYLDSRARGRARSTAEQLLGLRGTSVAVIDATGRLTSMPQGRVQPGMTALVPMGARAGVDGRVVDGRSDVDMSLVSGESLPIAVGPGDRVFAGTLNLSAPLRLEVTATGESTLLADIVRLMEAAEQGRGRHVALADRVARLYSPVVHTLAALTFVGWILAGGAPWRSALMTAIAVLIITCPCALALAVPVVQVVASSRLMRRGILLKSGDALERLRSIDTVVFDKTGVLTLGRLELEMAPPPEPAALAAAAALAGSSRHPLAQALRRACPDAPVTSGVVEIPGSGLRAGMPDGEVRLGSRRWCGVREASSVMTPEMWLARPGHPAVRFAFRDRLREDAPQAIAGLRRLGLAVELLSGDRAGSVLHAAAAAGISDWRADCSPADKAARLADLAAAGHRALMVGDGLNDAPSLAGAFASMSPASAADVSQTAADLVFQGDRLLPVLEAIGAARVADRLVRQNLALALIYNALAIPLAILGLATPLVAAVAMSGSSLVVIANALRLDRAKLA